MNVELNWAIAVAVGVVVLIGLVFVMRRYYETRHDLTYMTHDERGFKRALKGKGVLWDFEESIVRGPHAPQVGFVALDSATGERKNARLLDPRTGALNLRPQYCAPRPFPAVTFDGHTVLVDARVQFSLNRDLLRHVYEVQDFGQVLETRIHAAFRAEIGKRNDEDLRATLQTVERAVLDYLRQEERNGDEAGEQGMAIGVNFHTVNFTYSQPDAFSGDAAAQALAGAGATAEQLAAARAAARTQGVLALRPQQLDQLGDVFKHRDAGSTTALLALLDMQTRQNIAEALAASGQLVVLSPQELGLLGAGAQREAVLRRAAEAGAGAPAANGGARAELRA